MGWRGRYQLGQEMPITVLTVDGAGTPTVPDDPPTVAIWNATPALVKSILVPVKDRYGAPGLFGMKLFLGSIFSPGLHRMDWRWTTGGNAFVGMESDGFEILPGGSANGAIIAMYEYHRPQANFVVQQLDSGILTSGRNPHV